MKKSNLSMVILVGVVLLGALFSGCASSFVPRHFTIPRMYQCEHFVIRPINCGDALQDYQAAMESRDIIHQSLMNDSWPQPDFSLQENQQDIMKKERMFAKRKCFTYTVLNQVANEILGSVYINPGIGGPDAAVFMWVKKSAYEQGLDPILEKEVRAWIAQEWPFEWVVFPGRDQPITQ